MQKKIQRLPDAELDVMIALWNGHPGMSRSEIESFVNQKKTLAPTTILSMLTRLEKKGVVSVKREGVMNLYTAEITQEEYQQQESESVLEKLFDNSLSKFVTSLYQGRQISQDKLKELEELIQELEKK